MTTTRPVPANSLQAAIDYVKNGGRLVIRTATRVTIIDRKTLAAFEKAQAWLLKADGNGYRLRNGKSSVYLFPSQLEFIVE